MAQKIDAIKAKRAKRIFAVVSLIPLDLIEGGEDNWPMGLASHLQILYEEIEKFPEASDYEIATRTVMHRIKNL